MEEPIWIMRMANPSMEHVQLGVPVTSAQLPVAKQGNQHLQAPWTTPHACWWVVLKRARLLC